MGRNILLCVAIIAVLACGYGRVEGDHQVGYRRTELTYRNAKGKRVARKLSVWYPTRDKVGPLGPRDYVRLSKPSAKPAKVSAGAHPVVVFSHGLWSAPEFSSFLTEELARGGYVVAGVHHADALTEWSNHQPKMPEFLRPAEWDETTHADRGEDLRALLDHLLAEQRRRGSFLYGHLDSKSIGAMGHSMGGHTVGGLIGGWASWHDPRVRAALLLSPYIMPYLAPGRAERIKVSVMLQGATGDLGITPSLQGLYRRLPGPKYFLVLDHENHFSWTNLVCKGRPTQEAVRQGSPELIVRYSLAFFDRHLRGKRAAECVLRAKDPKLKQYVFEEPDA